MNNQPDQFRGTPDTSIVMKPEHTGWWYSRWIGVMYGKVPVGIIAAALILVIWAVTH
jgi:hypothetical protein